MRHCLWALWLGLACGRSQAPDRPESVPVSPGASKASPSLHVLHVGEDPKPITTARLTKKWPTIASLQPPAQEVVMQALNLVPGPCAPCKKETHTLAECALLPPVDACANIQALVMRAVSLARAGKALEHVREAVHYPDIWVPYGQPDGILIGPAAAQVRVDMWRGSESQWLDTAMTTLNALRELYPDQVRFHIHDLNSASGLAVGARATPTWAVAGYRMRGAQSVVAIDRLIRREIGDTSTEAQP